MRLGEPFKPLAALGRFVAVGCRAAPSPAPEQLRVPMQGDGVTALRGSAVGLASPSCSGGKNRLFALWFVTWDWGVTTGTRECFVKCSEILMWKKLMKYEIIAWSCQHWCREGFDSTKGPAAALNSPHLSFCPG